MVLREIVLLLETGSEEFKKGNASTALSILFEARWLLSEVVQRQVEMMQGPVSANALLGLRPSITVVIFYWHICLISESMGHHDSEIMDDGSID
jgi:hypothetical protein